MEEVLDTVEVGRPRRQPEGPQFLDQEQAEALIEQAREQGVELLGEGGLLKQMTKAVLERAPAEELTDLRKINKTRGRFPTDDALIKLLYLGCREMGRTTRAGRGGRSNYNWKIAMNQFDVMFPGRLDNA